MARFKMEFKIWRRAVEPHLDRWKKKPWSDHALVNIFVEGARVVKAAYFNGHLIVYSLALNVILMGVILWMIL